MIKLFLLLLLVAALSADDTVIKREFIQDNWTVGEKVGPTLTGGFVQTNWNVSVDVGGTEQRKPSTTPVTVRVDETPTTDKVVNIHTKRHKVINIDKKDVEVETPVNVKRDDVVNVQRDVEVLTVKRDFLQSGWQNEKVINIQAKRDVEVPVNNRDVEVPVTNRDVEVPVTNRDVEVPVNSRDVEVPVSNRDVDVVENSVRSKRHFLQSGWENEKVINIQTKRDTVINVEKKDVEVTVENPVRTKRHFLQSGWQNGKVVNIQVKRDVEVPVNSRDVEVPVNSRDVEVPVNNRDVEVPVNSRDVEVPINNRDVKVPFNNREVEVPINNRDVEVVENPERTKRDFLQSGWQNEKVINIQTKRETVVNVEKKDVEVPVENPVRTKRHFVQSGWQNDKVINIQAKKRDIFDQFKTGDTVINY